MAQTSTGTELWSIFLDHPVAILIGAVSLVSAAFFVARFIFEREISTLRTERDAVRGERDTLRGDVDKLRSDVEALRESLPVPVIAASDPPPGSVRDARSDYLRQRARHLAEALREVQELYSAYDHSFPPSGASEEERQRLWEEGIRRDDQRRMEVARRYSKIRGEVIAIRDEMLRRVHPSVAASRDKYLDHTYEMQAGPCPFHEIADDLEKLAYNLP